MSHLLSSIVHTASENVLCGRLQEVKPLGPKSGGGRGRLGGGRLLEVPTVRL